MSRQRPRLHFAVLLVIALLVAGLIGGVPGTAAIDLADYTQARIGGPDAQNTYTNLYDVNDAGTVVGDITDNNGIVEAFRKTSGGSIEMLGLPPTMDASTASAVNASEQIVGYMGLVAPSNDTRAFLWPPLDPADVLTDLGLLPGYTSGFASDINDAGQVVGYDTDALYVRQAFIWSQAGGLRAIPNDLGGTYSAATGINEAGQVVGYATDADDTFFGFIWTEAGGMVSLGTLPGGSYSVASAINEAGQVVGAADNSSGQTRAFLWSAATGMVDLGALPSDYVIVEVKAINDLGQVVGYGYSETTLETHAFSWFPGVGFVDFGAFGGRIGNANGVNNRGQVVIYTNANVGGPDRNRGLLLTPTDTTPPVTTATPTGTLGNGGLFRSDVTVNLAASDPNGGLGVARITYSATGAQAIAPTDAIGASAAPVITAEGETTLTFFATDFAGNQESPAKSVTVRIDKTAPVLTTTLGAATAVPGDTIAITVAASEPLAGPPTVVVAGPCLAPTPVALGAGGQPNTFVGSYTLPADTPACTVTVSANGQDVAGNPSTGGTATFTNLGSPPVAAVAQQSLAFGNQLVGTTSSPRQVIVTNTGGRPLAIASVALAGIDAGDFVIAYNSCGGNVVPNQSCVIGVAFAPTAVGARGASLVLTDTAADSPQSVGLTGTGTVGNVGVVAAATGPGAVTPAGTASYPAGTAVRYTAAPTGDAVFLGWTLDGQYVGYANPLTFTANGDRTLVARFAPRPSFADVPASDPDYRAISVLAGLGIINPAGVNGSGNFEPDRAVARAEVAAFVARVFGWETEFHRNTFPDRCDAQGQNCIDDELWNTVAALADYGVVGGYTDPATCASAGTTAPCYLPRDPVQRVQVVSIVARAFIKTPDLRPTGFWDRLAADPAQYTNLPDVGTQRSDLTTYRTNAGPVPGETSAAAFPNPSGNGTRRFVVAVLYAAFAAQYGIDRVP